MSVYQLDIQLLTNFSVYIRELYSNNNHLFQTAQGHTIIEILLKSN